MRRRDILLQVAALPVVAAFAHPNRRRSMRAPCATWHATRDSGPGRRPTRRSPMSSRTSIISSTDRSDSIRAM
jgi:hypothetical protein